MNRERQGTILTLLLVACWVCAQFCGVCGAHAAEPFPLCTSATLLRGGTPAPCSGLLVPEDEASKAAACLAHDLPACERRRVADIEEARIRREAVESLLRVEQDARRSCSTALDACSEIVTSTPGPEPAASWWSRAEVWGLAAGGVVVGVGVTLLVVWAAGGL